MHELLGEQVAEHQPLRVVVVVVVGALVVGRADDDDPAADAQHVDRRAVEAGQRLGRQHLVGRPIAHRPGARYSTRSTSPQIGLMSCVTNMTGVPAVRRRASISPVTICCEARSRDSSGSSASSSSGIGDQGLGDPQPLLLAAGERPTGVSA